MINNNSDLHRHNIQIAVNYYIRHDDQVDSLPTNFKYIFVGQVLKVVLETLRIVKSVK
jgi:hypothetical protein